MEKIHYQDMTLKELIIHFLRMFVFYIGFRIALTFDDVTLVPQASNVLPRSVSLRTRLTRKIWLGIPLISAAMDTVTGWIMAVVMAREGGIGIIHKNMSIEEQAEEVRKVKRADNGLILQPFVISDRATILDALKMMNGNGINGLPVLNQKEDLVGIITRKDIRAAGANKTSFVSEYMTKFKDMVTAKEGVTPDQAKRIFEKERIEKLPIVDRRNPKRLIGLMTYKDIEKIKQYPNASRDEKGQLLVGAAVGIKPDTIERVAKLVEAGVDVIVVDTAHAHNNMVVNMVREIKKRFPKLQVIAGNVVTKEAVRALAKAGADAVKVGIGSGSICTTRVIAGVGVPQLTAVFDCAKEAKKHRIPIISDGGIRYSGDIVKALAAGAETVMVGSILAGTDESTGENIIFEGRKFKSYRGMGSVEAMQDGSKDRYFQDIEDDIKKLVPEGIVSRVPNKGPVSETIYMLMGGLRAGMGYLGAETIALLPTRAVFLRITNAGMREAHPHDVAIIKEAPNYSYSRK